MVKKILLSLLLIVVPLIAVSCYPEYHPLPTGYNNAPTVTIRETITNTVKAQPTIVEKVVNLNDTTFVYPAKLCINNASEGTVKEFKVQLHNGNGGDSLFEIYYEQPIERSNEQIPTSEMSKLSGFYEPAPYDAVNWITFEPTKLIQAKWTENVGLTLAIPKDATTPDKWYFYIYAKDMSQGQVGVANGITIFVNMS